MSAGFRQKLMQVAAQQLGLQTDPEKERRDIQQSEAKQRQALKALALSKVARQAAYAGAGLTAFSLLAVTVYLLRRTLLSRESEG